MRLLTAAFLVALGFADLLPTDGERDGRRGNALYEDGSYAAAAESFASGLAALDERAESRLRYGLYNNLGAALLKSGEVQGARQALDAALRHAVSPSDAARSAYNAGNAAFAAQELEAALDHYRDTLLREPGNIDAKFNYEFVKRRLEEQQQQQQQQQDGGGEQNEDQQQDRQSPGEEGQDESQQNRQEQEGGDQPQQPQDGSQQEDEQRAPSDAEGQLSDEQAERILQALQNEEEQLLREVRRPNTRPRRVEKDW